MLTFTYAKLPNKYFPAIFTPNIFECVRSTPVSVLKLVVVDIYTYLKSFTITIIFNYKQALLKKSNGKFMVRYLYI